MTDLESKLVQFARWAIDLHREEMCDLDGCDMQDKLVELGILQTVRAEEPCGEGCYCAEYHGSDGFPVDCLQLVEGYHEEAGSV